MAHIAFRQNPTQPVTSITLHVGEESEKLVLVALPGDSGVNLMIFSFDSDLVILQELNDQHLDPQRNRVFSLVGAKSGSVRLEAWEIFSRDLSVTKLWASLDVVIQDPSESGVDFYYFGKYLVWRRSSPPFPAALPHLIFSACSGIDQWAAQQGMQDSGPIPEGLYTLLAQLDPVQDTIIKANRLGQNGFENGREGIQYLPRKSDTDNQPLNDQWGSMRVKLDKIKFESKWFRPTPRFGSSQTGFNRYGFYLHNSHKGFSHGCVEVGKNSNQQFFFDALLTYTISNIVKVKPRLSLRVSYRDANTETKGNTKFD